MSHPLDKKYLKEEEHEITAEGNKRYTICGMSFVTTKNYAVRKAVGQGAYGLVCSGRIIDSGKLVAIKKIPKAFEDTVDCKRLLREIKILRPRCQSPAHWLNLAQVARGARGERRDVGGSLLPNASTLQRRGKRRRGNRDVGLVSRYGVESSRRDDLCDAARIPNDSTSSKSL